jgi:crotonobetainyl-CoA:carnitine CoA-transferase CaiB-like acyl-CoA transferase
MTLGDLGADVVKVERPGTGDETRSWQPPTTEDGQSTYFLAVNRNKRSITLDLSTSEGQISARQLALRSDVVVENFAPGTMERYGLGYESLARERPDLVYASITGFGRTSPAPGYDFLVQAVGGLMSVTGDADGEPMKTGVAIVDVLAGQNLATGILAALLHRERTGEGQRVDVNLLGSLLSGLVNQASAYLNAGVMPHRMGNAHPSVAPYQTVAAADRPIALAVGTDGQFGRLAGVLDEDNPTLPALSGDDRFRTNADRVRSRSALTAELERRLVTRAAAHWVSRLTAAYVPCGLINTVAEGFALAESSGLDPVVRLTDERGIQRSSVRSPITLSATPATYRLPPPP